MVKITFKNKTKECKYYKGLKWDKDQELTDEMKDFEEDTGKNAIYRGVVTGTFEYWLYWAEYDKELKKKAKEEQINKLKQKSKEKSEKDDKDSIIELYKKEFGVKQVNIKSKKFKEFAKNH